MQLSSCQADTYAESTLCNVEYISGQEQHSSSWAKFYVKGLDKWAVRETDGEPQSDKHSSYSQFVCLDVPESQVFTIFEQDGDKMGTDAFKFHICKTSKEFGAIKSEYGRRHCTGNFEIICEGLGKTRAPRLMDWWQKAEKLTNEQKLAFAEHCAQHIHKRGIKKLPEFKLPEPTIAPTVNPTVKDEKVPPQQTDEAVEATVNPTVNKSDETSRLDSGKLTEAIAQETEPVTVNPTVNPDEIQVTPEQPETSATPTTTTATVNPTVNPVEAALLENPHRSDRSIAKLCGVSAPTVGKWRKRLADQGLIESDEKRIGANGKVMSVENIGTKAAPTQLKILELAETLSREEIKEIIEVLRNLV
ncbi:MAG: hypothetical protein ACM37W_16200 [Actinomycetota bacterium]